MTSTERRAAIDARVVLHALEWLDTPYRHQASVLGQGTDCLGLVRGVYRAVSGPEREAPPPYPRRLAGRSEPLLDAAGRYLIAADGPTPGRVILFRMRRSLPVNHCGIVVGPGHFIHAYEGQRVVISELSRFWKERIAHTYQFPEHL